jgi:hypothetical protein
MDNSPVSYETCVSVDAYTFFGTYVEFDVAEGTRRFSLTHEQATQLLEKLRDALKQCPSE